MSRPKNERHNDFYAWLTGDENFKDQQVVEVFLRGLYEMIDEKEMRLNIISDSAKGLGKLVFDTLSEMNKTNKKLRISPILPIQHSPQMFDLLDISMVCMFGVPDFGGYKDIPSYSIQRMTC